MTATYDKKIPARIRSHITADPDLATRYSAAKSVIRAFRRPAFYEIETRCNLKCEGCYYFEGGDTKDRKPRASVDEWEAFFRQEANRGVSMAYFVGAEPALAQERLIAAAPYFPFGNIGTNGTVRIDPAVPYRIGVSVWAGDDATDRRLRGASVFRKALRNYEGDPRAIMLFTISRWSIDHVPAVAEMCADHGVALTFNLYSPTNSFLSKIAQGAGNDGHFFRVSSDHDSPMLGPEDLDCIRHVLGEAIECFPETVIYSHAYNEEICRPNPGYTIDPSTGWATDCGSRIVEPMRYHTVDLEQASVKCCTPDIDCSQCRMYSGGWSSRFVPRHADVVDTTAFRRWLDMIETLGRIFLYPRDGHIGTPDTCRAPQP